MNLQPLSAQELTPDKPLPWPLFDEGGHVLFTQGETLAAGYPLDGLFRCPDGDAATPMPVEEFGAAGPFEDVSAGEMFPPNGIKPQMWEIVQVRLPERDGQPHYFTRLVGYIRNTSILVTIPRVRHQPVGMVEGERTEVRMLTGRNIYVFRAQVIKACLAPAAYMHLSFPDTVQRQSLRKAPSARANLPVSVENGGAPVEGMIANLSASGARVDAAAGLGEKGQNLKLAFLVDLDGTKRALSLSAQIMHIRIPESKSKANAGLVEHGVEFQGISEEDALWLRCLVYKRIAEGFLV